LGYWIFGAPHAYGSNGRNVTSAFVADALSGADGMASHWAVTSATTLQARTLDDLDAGVRDVIF